MKHSINKIKLNSGKDANQMLIRKLAFNFLTSGYMVTTETKAKILRTFIERIVTKSKESSEANKNSLLRYFPVKVINVLFEQVGPTLKDKMGGYTTTSKLVARQSDGALMVKIQWAHPVVINWEPKKVVKLDQADPKEKPAKTPKEVKPKVKAKKK